MNKSPLGGGDEGFPPRLPLFSPFNTGQIQRAERLYRPRFVAVTYEEKVVLHLMANKAQEPEKLRSRLGLQFLLMFLGFVGAAILVALRWPFSLWISPGEFTLALAQILGFLGAASLTSLLTLLILKHVSDTRLENEVRRETMLQNREYVYTPLFNELKLHRLGLDGYREVKIRAWIQVMRTDRYLFIDPAIMQPLERYYELVPRNNEAWQDARSKISRLVGASLQSRVEAGDNDLEVLTKHLTEIWTHLLAQNLQPNFSALIEFKKRFEALASPPNDPDPIRVFEGVREDLLKEPELQVYFDTRKRLIEQGEKLLKTLEQVIRAPYKVPLEG